MIKNKLKVTYTILIFIINIILRQAEKHTIGQTKNNIKSSDPILDKIIQDALNKGNPKENKENKNDTQDNLLDETDSTK
ncbi:MAG: hypothetical protein EOL95_08205 [Bacteroidia bacterium]|nr:hypothetical protein [Bacteroidia bacterium]